MKKIVLFAAALVACSATFAQTGEITSNRGENWLSQDGDWGLTFDANPLLNYAGNLFNGHLGNNIGGGLTWANSNFAIQGKKLVDANTAYRGKVRIGFGSTKNTSLVSDAVSTDVNATVEDTQKNGFFALNLGVGLEKRVGSTRVVGVYGAMFNIGLTSSKSKYEYGNALSADNTSNAPQFGQGAGVTEVKNGSTFGLGLSAFAGIEWFCAPKISLSGEYGWGFMLATTGFGETTSEAWTTNAAGVTGIETTTTEGPTGKQSAFSLDTSVSGATIGVNFYFQ
jgi:hypothetical protein